MPTPLTDWSERNRDLATLMARTGLGDRAAFATLYERTRAHLYAVILRINRDRALAEDILQEVYVSAWHAAAGYEMARSQPLTWLTRIARNRAIDSLRRVQTQPQFRQAPTGGDGDDVDPHGAEDSPDEGPGPLELLSRAADARALHHCMDDLNAAQRQSLAFAFYDGLSHAEVADRMGKPLGTVKSFVRRALQALKACLEAAASKDVPASPRSSGREPASTPAEPRSIHEAR